MRRMLVVTALGLLSACSSDGNDAPAQTPTQKCQQVQSNLCDRAMECLHDMDHATCVTTVNFTSRNCDNITGVADSYDVCITQIDTEECEVLFPGTPGRPPISPPAMCEGAFSE
jgi:hypothetical protein